MDTPFIIEQEFDAPIKKVWQALTLQSKMKDWYFPQILNFKPVVGFEFKFTDDGSTYQKDWRVTRAEEDKILAHSWVYKGYPGRSEVTFELFDLGNKTRLKLTHTGLASFPHDPHFARIRFEDGWTRIIGGELKSFLDRDQ
jgi:uncharacterized protein YndB with AHSA1/START domain